MKTKRKRTIWAMILAATLIIFLATGCKPKQIIQERVITKADSTAFAHLTNEVSKRDSLVEMMRNEIQAAREEKVRLQGEVSKHEINYNTSAPVNPGTGKYPIASEVITESRTLLEKSIKEFELLKQEYRKEVESLTRKNTNLEMTVKALSEENRELKSRITPTTGFNFRLFFSGMGIGVLLMIALLLFLRFK